MNACVQLPGGALINGEIQRFAWFRPITGKVELLITSPANQYLGRPAWVSAVLAAAIEKIGAIEMSVGIADRLTVGDRIFLMLQLGIRYTGDQMWLTPACESCGEQFDVSVKRSELPVQKAGNDYPSALVNINKREVRLRAINGKDQQWLNENPSAEIVQTLLNRCVQTADGKLPVPEFINGLDRKDCDYLESVIQNIGPDVDCTLLVRCPECSVVQEVEIDPYWLGQTQRSNLDNEVHTLAFYYHWSEAEILNLTRERRHTFLNLIDKERGCHA